ncbi:hypothetical protein DNHGIG_18250 [Collibacillus ludicampi]|uniref:CAAX prenyl protease 2/Lysostaphin resistance protein A-like domain-containing protein n=1 Tax=Collibacillus ludicampi TaxID=2771369 RepID=A0AAV4LEQ3_9BACL|nr:CPBP family intramembrane glutamic endopeptidase [Collibacillus ludicampi]GIM46276.1 hypothetical protein DNHGIG_18250 [Collibacillus ludicampi]
MKTAVSSFRLSPIKRVQLNKIRLTIDVLGVTLIRLIDPLIHTSFGHTILSIYNVAAWITILTLDPTRIPEFTTTRNQQKKAWLFTLKLLPVILIGLITIALGFQLPVLQQTITPSSVLVVGLGSYMDELLFRNTLQPKLRQWGFSRFGAIATQSLLFAASWWISYNSIGLMVSALFIGLVNGWIVYKYRSLWPVFIISFIWRVII